MKNSALKLVIGHRSPPRAPQGLRKPGQKLWREIQRQYLIEDSGGVEFLMTACRSQDELATMRALVEKDGCTLLDRFGQIVPHPLLAAIARTETVKRLALHELGLDLEPIKSEGRPRGK